MIMSRDPIIIVYHLQLHRFHSCKVCQIYSLTYCSKKTHKKPYMFGFLKFVFTSFFLVNSLRTKGNYYYLCTAYTMFVL